MNLGPTIIRIFEIIVFIRIILSWFPLAPDSRFEAFIFQLTEPLLSRIRKLLPEGIGLDFSPMVLLVGLEVIRWILF